MVRLKYKCLDCRKYITIVEGRCHTCENRRRSKLKKLKSEIEKTAQEITG